MSRIIQVPDEGEEPSQMRKWEMGALLCAASLVGTREAWEDRHAQGQLSN